jgi:flagellar biosynthesis/type III secretory pathway M-ring protein FliF/YscJ
MKSPKPRPKLAPTTTDLRAKDLNVQRAEIAVFCQKIAEKATREPHKAAFVLKEWLDQAPKKKAA